MQEYINTGHVFLSLNEGDFMAVYREEDHLGLDYALKFTQAYRAGTDIYQREILCEDVQFPAVLRPPREGDFLCGRRMYPEAGYSVQYGGLGYYFNKPDTSRLPEGERELWDELDGFWRKETTQYKCRESFSPEVRRRLAGDFSSGSLLYPAYALYRMAGLQLDYGRLVSLGIPGLESEVESRSASSRDLKSAKMYDCFRAHLGRLRRCIDHYLSEADLLPDSERTRMMRSSLAALRDGRPGSFIQGLQLVLLVQTVSGTINFGRLDRVLGPLLADDLRRAVLTRDRAMDILENFYSIINEEILHFDGRIILGGRGRSGEEEADLFALLAMDTMERAKLPMPQISLRFYEGQNPLLLKRAYDLTGRGGTFPILYNDDVNIPAVENAYGLDRATAEQYAPFGCGEYMIDSGSCSTPNFIINLAMCLELALNGGRPLDGEVPLAPDFGSLDRYNSFDELWKGYTRTVGYFLEAGAEAQKSIYETTALECPFSLVSLLYGEGLEGGLSFLDGGISFLGGTNETYGNNNTADSLTAVRELVFNRKMYSGKELLNALKSNWTGRAEMFREFKAAPKFGNDETLPDDMARQVHEHICLTTSSAGKKAGLHHFLVVIINNNTNTLWGKCTSASADGRRSGEPLAPGNSAAAGADRSGLTALLNSMAGLDTAIHGGSAQNIMVSSDFPGKSDSLYRALFNGYWKKGGGQIMITTTCRDDLLKALEHPENYANLIVRVGGFSARFIDLDPATQREVLSRTEYGT